MPSKTCLDCRSPSQARHKSCLVDTIILDKRYLASIATALALFAASARADDFYRGTGLICDTVEEIDAFIKADDEGKNPMQTVNAAEPVCGVGPFPTSSRRSSNKSCQSMACLRSSENTVVGVAVNGRFNLVTPLKQITVFMAEGGTRRKTRCFGTSARRAQAGTDWRSVRQAVRGYFGASHRAPASFPATSGVRPS